MMMPLLFQSTPLIHRRYVSPMCVSLTPHFWLQRPSLHLQLEQPRAACCLTPFRSDSADFNKETGEFCVQIGVPGFAPGDMKLDLDGRVLTFTAERREGVFVRRMERTISLPDEVDVDTLKCEFDERVGRLAISGSGKVPEAVTATSIPIAVGRKPDALEPNPEQNASTTVAGTEIPSVVPEKSAPEVSANAGQASATMDDEDNIDLTTS